MGPIGSLILEGERESAKKSRGEHTATAACACQVTIARFGASSYRADIRRCSEHALDPNRKM